MTLPPSVGKDALAHLLSFAAKNRIESNSIQADLLYL